LKYPEYAVLKSANLVELSERREKDNGIKHKNNTPRKQLKERTNQYKRGKSTKTRN